MCGFKLVLETPWMWWFTLTQEKPTNDGLSCVGPFHVLRRVLWRSSAPAAMLPMDVEGSRSPSPGFLSVILKAVLAYKCCLAEQEGRDACHQAKSVPCCMTSRICLYWEMTKRQSWKAEAERCLNTRPESAPALGSNQLCEHLWCLCLTWCYTPHVIIILQHSELFFVSLSRLLGTSVCPVTVSLYCCLLLVHLSCTVRNCWLLSPLKTTHLFEGCGTPFLD